MRFVFYKYQGCGNDFILVNDTKGMIHITPLGVVSLCKRCESIGADGVVLLSPSRVAHKKMTIFNADGTTATMCGNALRCVTHFIGDECQIETLAGVYDCKVEGDTPSVTLKPIKSQYDLTVGKIAGRVIDSGTPHFVFDWNNKPLDSLEKECALIYKDLLEKGVEANVTAVNISDSISCATYEKGVHKVTLSCGTGAYAAAVFTESHDFKAVFPSQHEMKIWFDGSFWHMTGKVVKVFRGEISLQDLFGEEISSYISCGIKKKKLVK